MNIPINRDLERDYKDDFWKGFSLREAKYIAAGLAVAVAAGMFCWLYLKLPVTAAIYIGVPTAAPILYLGFKRTANGLTPLEDRRAVRYRKATKKLCYKAGEYDPGMVSAWQEPKGHCLEKVDRRQKKGHRKYVRAHERAEKKMLRARMRQLKRIEKKNRKKEGFE